MSKSKLMEELEYRRDAWKALAEGAKEILPQMAKALGEKADRDLLTILESDREK